MPRYEPRRIEAKWQRYWEEHATFQTPNTPPAGSRGKLYVLDMFPYPSGSGLHVGHPEGYTATDIVCRYSRMRGKHVLHPMGWDAFGLPAEQHAIRTGTHPRTTTYQNIDTFRRQLKMLGFSYDWSRELSTTDEPYFRWTQWIFLELFDTWYDPSFRWTGPEGKKRIGKGRPITELPIPDAVHASGTDAVRRYQDKHRLAYISEAPVNWCPALGTVLANEEVIDGKSERGGHPVVRLPLRQWMLRITAYADRLLSELDEVEWPESIKALQRNWIGRSTGAEVDFFVEGPRSRELSDESREKVSQSESLDSQLSSLNSTFAEWQAARGKNGYPAEPDGNVLRIYTTRPDTLFGATYMVVAPEHPIVEGITTPEQRAAVNAYRQQASFKSDLDRTDLAKEKTGVFTGAHAINPVNGERVPIWIADYVLISYGTGAIMAVPAHDERDFEFAVAMGLPVRTVVAPPDDWLAANHAFNKHKDAKAAAFECIERASTTEHERPSAPLVRLAKVVVDHDPDPQGTLRELHRDFPHLFSEAFAGEGIAVNSGAYDGVPTAQFKQRITADLNRQGLGREAVNYRLRDWLFSRQHYWGEPFPIWHELGADGQPTGLMRADPVSELPVRLPDDFDFKPHGRPEPPLEEASDAWLYKTADDGVRLKRETNSMPQWAGSCWYYLRFCDPKNSERFIDPAVEKYWMPVDLYIGGAEHAVLHLLYARFWHKLLFDRGHVSLCEPFRRLVNQGMILGEAELTGYAERSEVRGQRSEDGEELVVEFKDVPTTAWVSLTEVSYNKATGEAVTKKGHVPLVAVKIPSEQVAKQGNDWVLKDRPEIAVESRAFKMSKSRGNVVNPDDVVAEYGADALRMYEMFMGPLEQVKPWSMSGVEGVYRFLGRVWRLFADDRADDVRLSTAVQTIDPTDDQVRLLHKTIKAVTEDIEKLSFNTAISRMMEFTNELTSCEARPRAVLEPFVLLLSPFAPHLAEELWSLLGHAQSLAYAPWPEYDESQLVADEIELPVQINGKVRARIKVPAGADQAMIEQLALASATVQQQLAGKSVAKIVVVPGRMVNIVAK